MAQYVFTTTEQVSEQIIITPTAGKSIVINTTRMINPGDSGRSAVIMLGTMPIMTTRPGGGPPAVVCMKGGVDEPVRLSAPVGVTVLISYEEV